MRAIESLQLDQFVFFDIETAPLEAGLEELPDALRDNWLEREARSMAREAEKTGSAVDPQSWYFDKAALTAEFGRVVCIAVGFFNRGRDGLKLRIKTIGYPEEQFVLEEFAQLLEKHYGDLQRFRLCGHNIKGFDVPFLCRRMMANRMKLPTILDTAGIKPWDNPHVDTLELWRFGEFRHYVSLKLLAAMFDVPTPKDDISGKDVGRVFWEESDLDRICNYCAKDVVAVARLIQAWKAERMITDDDIMLV